MFVRNACFMLMLIVAVLPPIANAQSKPESKPRAAKKLMLAHYMPWFEASEDALSWGWHWTMNAVDPLQRTDGHRNIAAHFHPAIGPYGSGDAAVIEYHLLTMKLAGIDGVIIDWYGLQNFRDYAGLHRNTQRLIERADQLGMSFAICYEDQTIPALVAAGKLPEADRVKHATNELDWVAKNWFTLDGYVKIDGRPLLLSFGQDGLKEAEWEACLKAMSTRVAYFSQHNQRKPAAGAFDWPVPKEGTEANVRFLKNTSNRTATIPVAFPRFVDYYAEAKVHASWGRIEDRDGETFKSTLRAALAHDAQVIQIATWNDWGEGTMIEPSVEFGTRDLQVVQSMCRELLDPKFAASEADLTLPKQLFDLRRNSTASQTKQLDSIAKQLSQLQLDQARSALKLLTK